MEIIIKKNIKEITEKIVIYLKILSKKIYLKMKIVPFIIFLKSSIDINQNYDLFIYFFKKKHNQFI